MKKLICAVLLASMLTGCIEIEHVDAVDNVTEGEIAETADLSNIEEQIAVEVVKADSAEWRGVGVLVTNNSAVTIGELEVQVLFYNEEGQIIDTATDGHDVILPGSTVVSYSEAPSEYARYDYKLDVDVNANGSYKNHAADVKIETNIGEECIILQITNNAEVDIEEFEYAVVFYKNGEIVDVTNGTDVYDIESGDTVIEECGTWGVDFDTYKVFINQAHTFW